MEEICDHPKYGLVTPSFERDEEWQKIDVTHPNNNCDVDHDRAKNMFNLKLEKIFKKFKEIFS